MFLNNTHKLFTKVRVLFCTALEQCYLFCNELAINDISNHLLSKNWIVYYIIWLINQYLPTADLFISPSNSFTFLVSYLNHNFFMMIVGLFVQPLWWKNISFVVNVHIINFELIFIYFNIILYWLLSFIFIPNTFITVRIINFDIVHHHKSNCKFLSNFLIVL